MISLDSVKKRDGIFKLTPIDASSDYQIPWIDWISIPFRENSNIPEDIRG